MSDWVGVFHVRPGEYVAAGVDSLAHCLELVCMGNTVIDHKYAIHLL